MKLSELIVGKTIASVDYISHEFIGIGFTDDSYVRIDQASQAGNLHVNCLLGDESVVRVVKADDKE
jgi:hypothetical protein